MNKVEKDIVNEFVTKLLKSGTMLQNASLPAELHCKGENGQDNPFGGTKILTMQQFIDAWKECREKLETIDENKSRAGEG